MKSRRGFCFLPDHAIRRRTFSRSNHACAGMLIVCIATSVMICGISRNHLRDALADRISAEQEYQSVAMQISALNVIAGNNSKLATAIQSINTLVQTGRISPVLAEISAAVPPGVYMQDIVFDDSGQVKVQSFHLTGAAEDNDALPRFVKALRRSQRFQGVSLADHHSDEAEAKQITFELEMTLNTDDSPEDVAGRDSTTVRLDDQAITN